LPLAIHQTLYFRLPGNSYGLIATRYTITDSDKLNGAQQKYWEEKKPFQHRRTGLRYKALRAVSMLTIARGGYRLFRQIELPSNQVPYSKTDVAWHWISQPTTTFRKVVVTRPNSPSQAPHHCFLNLPMHLRPRHKILIVILL